MGATVRKNTKAAKAVFENATSCRVYTLDNYFNGEVCEPKHAENELHEYKFAKLWRKGDGVYVVHVHSNRWYEVWTDADQAAEADTKREAGLARVRESRDYLMDTL